VRRVRPTKLQGHHTIDGRRHGALAAFDDEALRLVVAEFGLIVEAGDVLYAKCPDVEWRKSLCARKIKGAYTPSSRR
jgi:hypothetical protein